MNEVLKYTTVEALERLPLEEVNALWELVPTDRQRRYKAVYDREVRNAGASGSDTLELQVAGELLTRYVGTALVPVGARWARTPARIQETAKHNADLVAPETLAERDVPTAKRPVLLILGGVVFVLAMLLIFSRLGGRGNRDTANLGLTSTASLSPTPRRSPTPTPIALENQDPVIRGGDGDRAAAFPVNLRVTLPDTVQPRVFVVQRRVIQTAEWNYDPNPDTASYLAGLTVRPVIGVPYSEENADLFERMALGTTFTLYMNTGATLRFDFAERSEVSRSDTARFRQTEPGLVLLLIGERGADGMPTGMRTMISATYATEQELSRSGALSEAGGILPTPEPSVTPSPTQTPLPLESLDVQVISVITLPGQVIVRLRLYNDGEDAVQITEDMIWMALGYTPEPDGPQVSAEGLSPFDLLPGQAADMTLHWTWQGEPHASMHVGSYQYSIHLK